MEKFFSMVVVVYSEMVSVWTQVKLQLTWKQINVKLRGICFGAGLC